MRQFALHRQQFEKDKQNVDFAHPWKNFCGRPCESRMHKREEQTEEYIWKTEGKWFYAKPL